MSTRRPPPIGPEQLEELARRLSGLLPPGLSGLRDELEQNFRGVLQGGLEKLDLVSREEFEVQKAVLAKTRSRLEQLEQQLADIEKALSPE
ncbi:MAG: accessory factor UbiK family protein [Nevskiales bacterium]